MSFFQIGIELPFFVSSNNEPILNFKGKKVLLGICYESLQQEHYLQLKESNVDFYITTVAKPENGTQNAASRFPLIAKEFNTTIFMSNSVGYCDNFLSNGLSSIWNKKGELVGQLDKANQGLLIFDEMSNTVKKIKINSK